jgi:exopolysaccharide biosynthesis polyprenyl glycosylphosphotransferase
MLRSHALRLERALRTADFVVAAIVALGVIRFRGAPEASEVFGLLVLASVATFAYPITLGALGLYRSQRRESFPRLMSHFAVAGGLVAAVLVGTVLLLGRPDWANLASLCAFAQTAVFTGQRVIILSTLRLLRRRGRNFRHAVVLGSGPRARAFASEVSAHPEWGVRIVSFLDEIDVPYDPALATAPLRKLVDFPEVARNEVIDEVVVAMPRSMIRSVEPVVRECGQRGIPVTVLSELFADVLPALHATQYGRFPVLQFATVAYGPLSRGVKRTIDILGASFSLLLFAPVLAASALAIRLTSPGPVIFRQTRLGKNGRPFQVLKLRSMVVDAEARQAELVERNEMSGPVFKVRDDPRVTPVGRFLRTWSLDELPQLWNVLRGEMSLVGPRPPLPHEVIQYEARDRRRLSVRPGITCLWQINGRSHVQFADWVEMDLYYIDHWSLWLDLRILLRTPLAVVRRDGAF